jgi:hypothetical protein
MNPHEQAIQATVVIMGLFAMTLVGAVLIGLLAGPVQSLHDHLWIWWATGPSHWILRPYRF